MSAGYSGGRFYLARAVGEGGDVSWMLGGHEVVNGVVLELRLHLPRVWMPVWIEGMPETPLGCYLAGRHQLIQIPLFEGDAVLRWPAGVDHRMMAAARRRVQASVIRDVADGVFARLGDVERCVEEVLSVVEIHAGKYQHQFCREALACVYPKEVAAIEVAEKRLS